MNKTFVRARNAGRVAALLSLRIAGAGFGLVSVILTKSLFSDSEYLGFAACSYGLTLAGVALTPINQDFWANRNGIDLFRTTLMAGISLAFAVPTAFCCVWLTGSFPHANLIEMLQLSAAAFAYAGMQMLAAFFYGRAVLLGQPLRGVSFTTTFALLDVTAVLVLLGLQWQSISLRLVFPSCLFAAALPWIIRYTNTPSLKTGAFTRTATDLATSFREVMLSTRALTTVFAGCLMSLLAAGDRILIREASDLDPSIASSTTAAYVFAAVIAVSYLSILGVVIDQMRSRIWRDFKLTPDATDALREVSGVILLSGSLFAICVGGFNYAVGIFPQTVSKLFWAVTVTRVSLICILNILFLDLWNTKRNLRIIASCLILAAGHVALMLSLTPIAGISAAALTSLAYLTIIVAIEFVAWSQRWKAMQEVQRTSSYASATYSAA